MLGRLVDSWTARLLVCFSKFPMTLSGTRSAFEFAFFNTECLSEHSEQAAAQAYLAYLTDALRFESVVSTALAMFFTVMLLQLGGIPDPFVGKVIYSLVSFPHHDSLIFLLRRGQP